MLTFFLNAAYCLLVLLMLPLVIWKRLRTGKYRQGWGEKLFGRLPDFRHDTRPCIWLHAVSVGEVLQLRQIVQQLQSARPDIHILVTTTTETGYAVARKKLIDCDVSFFPLDFSWSVRTALKRVQPDLIVLVELELWPNFILNAALQKIPLLLINGRISENSSRGYSRIRPLVRRLVECFTGISVQTEEYRQRFLKLGADAQTTVVTGSIKFDGVQLSAENSGTRELREWLKVAEDAPVFVAGSTQAPEEQLAMNVYTALLPAFPSLRLVIVPRHPERGTELVDMLQQQGFPVQQRSNRQFHPATTNLPEVGLLDTVGELGACWGVADVAFVGGSFTSRGGQNMLEPAAYGAAVCFGPNTWNFRQIVEMLIEHDAACTVRSGHELQEFVSHMLVDSLTAAEMGSRAQELILSQQGATDRTVKQILQTLPVVKAALRSKAA